jgi:hypothetical protein
MREGFCYSTLVNETDTQPARVESEMKSGRAWCPTTFGTCANEKGSPRAMTCGR